MTGGGFDSRGVGQSEKSGSVVVLSVLVDPTSMVKETRTGL